MFQTYKRPFCFYYRDERKFQSCDKRRSGTTEGEASCARESASGVSGDCHNALPDGGLDYAVILYLNKCISQESVGASYMSVRDFSAATASS